MAEEIKAPLAGKVISVLVEVGDSVEEDEEIMVLEAMKMETSVYSTAEGKVSQIRVRPGDSVEEDDILMTVE
ncbi:MAG: biotin/lipoyl-containing protein [Desulfosalsimonas sp.]